MGNNKIVFENMIDHRSYAHNLSSCEIKKPEKTQGWVVQSLIKLTQG